MHANNTATHESYGLICISRASTNPPMPLFGTAVKTGHPIFITISTAEVYDQNTTQESYLPEKQLIEVALSQTQFAELITSLNVGQGSPCTIQYVQGDKTRRQPPPEKHILETVNNELKATMGNVTKSLNELKIIAQNVLDQKGNIPQASRKELLDQINRVLIQLQHNAPYVHEKINEAVEDTIVKAKAEINAHAHINNLPPHETNLIS